jgi:CHASE2 domain-containing sensor protein
VLERQLAEGLNDVGILWLILLVIAALACYAFHLSGAWRWTYVVTAMAALYLNCFVGAGGHRRRKR